MASLRLSQRILDFWFEGLQPTVADSSLLKKWFSSSSDTDTSIRTLFGTALEEALQHPQPPQVKTPQECLAQILLLDQFTRNIFRGSPQAFSGDLYALKLAQMALEQKWDQQMQHPLHQAFMYMPFEHSEELKMQDLSVKLFEALYEKERKGPFEKMLQQFSTSAVEHQEIVKKFGRFPHRNAALSRSSTPEEEAYLKTAQRFGQ